MKRVLIIILLFITVNCKGNNKSDTSIIRNHLLSITKTDKFRNFKNIDQLNEIANYILNEFLKYTDSVSTQEYNVNGEIYKNVICSFGTENQKRIIVGAHYDVCYEQEGADDNASGVVGLLELARLLKGQKLNYRIDLVAYTLEEPPFFNTKYMGSYIHSKSIENIKENVYGMISLEMIGYFKSEKNSQTYPLGVLSLFFGNKGDYITIVKKFGAGKFARKFSKYFKSNKSIKTVNFSGPTFLPGISFSDHFNYWDMGISALMITDTAFYRNSNYHKNTDKMDTLDILKMSDVISGVFSTLLLL